MLLAMGNCIVGDCDRTAVARKMCGMHYKRWAKHGDPAKGARRWQAPMCVVENCGGKPIANSMCGLHYERLRRHGDPNYERQLMPKVCIVVDCGRPSHTQGLCRPHSWKQRRYGDPLAGRTNAPRGSGYRHPDGYIRLWKPDHPNASRSGQILEHTMVMSEMLGRPLLKGEQVHHRNGNRSDNRPENLELWVVSQPKGQRVEDLVEWARKILETYDL